MRDINIYKYFLDLEKKLFLVSIRQGFILLIPVFMTGASALMLLYFPIPFIREYIGVIWGGKLSVFLNLIFQSTFGFASILLLISVTYKYSSNTTHNSGALNILSCIVAAASYIALLGIKPIMSINGINHQVIILTSVNVQSIFTALLCSVVSTKIFLLLVKKLSSVNIYAEFSTDIDFKTSLSTLVPMFLTIAFFAFISVITTAVFHVASFNELVVKLLSSPFEKTGRSIWSALLILLIESLFWFFGIHGSNVFESVNLHIFPDVQGEILTKTFFDVFVLMGGCGTTICLLISIFLFSKLKAQKLLGKSALLPMLFNINEIMVFGLPIVLNPVMFIPFIITPLVTLTVSYLAILIGLVPAAAASVAWTTPVLISGYIAAGSIKGSILQIFTITLGVLIYTPFVKTENKLHAMKIDNLINEMTEIVKQSLDKGIIPELFKRNDYISKAAKELALNLRKSIEKGEIELFYQPQHDNLGCVVSCEALLRWKYDQRNYLYPPLVIQIAREDGSFSLLTEFIIKKAIDDTAVINQKFGDRISVSINIDSTQLNNLELINKIILKVNENNIIENTFGIEITEESELKNNGNLEIVFNLLSQNHIKLAIDDFSTGHTSLVYLQNNKFDFVKLDGSLVRNLLLNERSFDIIKSIIELGKSLEFEVIAEFVENEEQKKILQKMGCSRYQGYLYSPALSLDRFIEYTRE